MSLTTCLLVLALSASSATDDVGAGRPVVEVPMLTRLVLAPVEPPAEERIERDGSVRVFAVSSAVALRTCRPQVELASAAGSVAESPWLGLLSCCARVQPFRSLWLPTELRWQAESGRRGRRVAPPAILPIAWLIDRPPLTWPAPAHERPRPAPNAWDQNDWVRPGLCDRDVCLGTSACFEAA